MKILIQIMISMMTGCMLLVFVMTMFGRMNRSMEVKANFPSVVEEVLETAMSGKPYVISGVDEMMADFVENIVSSWDSYADMQLDIFGCDTERGILSAKVIMHYKQPTGTVEAIDCTRTAIFERRAEEEPLSQYQVTFYVDNECYKVYTVCENSVISAPAIPGKEGQIFFGWLDEEWAVADISEPVMQNRSYYAGFE